MNELRTLWKRIKMNDLRDDERFLRFIYRVYWMIRRPRRNPFRILRHRTITRYLHASGNAMRDGYTDGGYIVWMSAQTFHDWRDVQN